jgi:hypothetical protein
MQEGGAAAAKKLPKTVATLFSGVCEQWSEKASPSRAELTCFSTPKFSISLVRPVYLLELG